VRAALVIAIGIAVVASLAGNAGHAQDVSAWTEQHGAFAFPDETGTRLLSTAEIPKPDQLHTALCTGGGRVAIRFLGRQTESANSTHRQTSDNFAHTAGSAFRIVDRSVNPSVVCFLAADSFIAGTAPVPLRRAADGSRCSRDLYPDFESAKQRPVPIAESPAGADVVLVEFARRLRYALASLAVVDRDRRMYVDYPADFTGPGADLWRVDDGGEIHARDFESVFLMTRGSSYLMAIAWSAAEGIALSLLISEEEHDFRQVISDSWYRSPL
jgi:hypothetical protein